MGNEARESTARLIARAAKQRGLHVRDFGHLFEGFFELRLASRRELIYYSSTDYQGHVTFRACNLKPLTGELLRQAGFPAPDDQMAHTLGEAEAFLHRQGKIVVKPVGGSGGHGVTPGITHERELRLAVTKAQAANENSQEKRVLCQTHIEGRDFRLLVINQKHVLAAERVPAHIIGDGYRTLRELVDQHNQKKLEPYHIRLDAEARILLEKAQLTFTDVIEEGRRVPLAQVANAHAGGWVRDVTDQMHADVREMACRVARHFRMPVVGVDWVSGDIGEPQGMVIELNATPDLTIHHFPDEGETRDAVGLFLDMLFPEAKSG